MKIEERLINCLEENGLKFDENGLQGIVDSFVLVSTMVSIEEEFDIEIPEVYLGKDLFSSIQHLCEVVESLL